MAGIRVAMEADQPAIRRLIKEAKINRVGLAWPNFVVAEEEGAIVGVGQVKAHGDGSREMASIAVAPAWQRRGIASAIITTILAREPNVVLHLTCRRELEHFYTRFGFRTLVAGEYPPYFARMIPLINLAARLIRTRILVMRREPAGPTGSGQVINK